MIQRDYVLEKEIFNMSNNHQAQEINVQRS